MRNVIPGRLWIGNVQDVANISRVYDAGIDAIIDLAVNEKPSQLTRDLIYCRFPLNDSGGNVPGLLRVAVETVASFMTNEIPILVYCSAGMSRSVAIVSMAVAIVRQEPLDKTLVSVANNQPHDVSPLLWAEVCKACGR